MEKIDKWVMLAIGLVGGWVISTAPGWMHASSHEDWWGIATAVGTVGAVITALALSAWEALRRRRDAQDRASLYAASVADKLQVCIDRFGSAPALVLVSEPNETGKHFTLLKMTVDGFSANISNDDLLPLIALDNRAAHKIAHGLAQIDATRRLIEDLTRVASKNVGFPFVSNEEAKSCAGYILDAVRLLGDAREICARASRIEDRRPARRAFHAG